jgi:CDP-diacylglycerol--serine O-phosphatidyltransferase
MFCGFLSIITASNGNYNYAAWLIIIAAVFDALDGLVARLTKSSSELGVELDSLSDIVSFGCAPSFLLYVTYFHQFDNFGVILSSLPLIAGGFRLARFNVQLVGFEKSFFLGLPIPTAALTIASFVLAFYNNGYPKPYSDMIIPMVIIGGYKRKTVSFCLSVDCIVVSCVHIHQRIVLYFCFINRNRYFSPRLLPDKSPNCLVKFFIKSFIALKE